MSARANRTEVQKYFPFCPFCSEKSVRVLYKGTGEDFALCEACGAQWHTYISNFIFQMRWAELIQVGNMGGTELLGIKHEPRFWRDMALRNLKNPKQRRKTESDSEEKAALHEIIREKEVIDKIRCPYCHKTYDETLDKCPNCGA